MTASDVGYAQVPARVKPVLGPVHAAVILTIAWAVPCLLLAQRVTAAALARALPAEQAGSGRSGLRRARRGWAGPALAHARISPPLIRLALTRRPPGAPVVVALDTTRRGRWAVGLAGIASAGRTLPIGGAVLPRPRPRGRVRATTPALIEQVQAASPAGVDRRLVAERGFPRAAPVAQSRPGGTAWAARLRLSDWLTVGGVYATVGAQLPAGRPAVGQRTAATSGRGPPASPLAPARVVVTAAVALPPRRKPPPGTARARAKRAQAQAQPRQRQRGRRPTAPSATAQQ